MRRALPLLLLLPLALALGQDPPRDRHAYDERWESEPGSSGCVKCHKGIEEIHPAQHLTCIDCHGGDAGAATKDRAHVAPQAPPPNDERVLSPDHDLRWQRFVNPSNLRVVKDACGDCHDAVCKSVPRSLHGTTAGHLNDGLYENGVSTRKKSGFGIFPVEADPAKPLAPNALRSLSGIPAGGDGPRTSIATHAKDVPRKACMRCHLYGKGRAVRGRLGMDGDYRSEGCAACHATYADDGLTATRDRSIDKFEPGHPLKHAFTSRIPTDTCTRCHVGDASIGLHFRGLAQLVPGMPAGPRVPGTTDRRLNGTFYVKDEFTPPDVHHEKGMACIDCHTAAETMGDGQIYGFMEHGVEVSCEACHGTFDAAATFRTKRGSAMRNLSREGEAVFLTGKLDGARRRVPQARDAVSHNAAAAKAMTKDHARLTCWACHSAWNVNFFGFHLDRHEGFTQLDQLSGRRTTGRVTTLEKVFASFRQLTLGFDSSGRISTYLVGFSTTCTVHDKEGREVLDQAMPETAAGLSGMTMIHHQVHTVRKRARACVECHRSPTALGMGSSSFRLARRAVYAATDRGLEAFALDRKSFAKSTPRVGLERAPATRIAVLEDHVQGQARWVALAHDDAVSLVDPRGAAPRETDRLAIPGARGFAFLGRRHLLVAAGGLKVVRLPERDRDRARIVGSLALPDARDVQVAFRKAFVADGQDGLVVVDVDAPDKPRVVARLALEGARSLALAFQFSRHRPGDAPRTRARHLAFVACAEKGLAVVDVTDTPEVIGRVRAGGESYVAVAFASAFDLGSEGGGIPSRERDYVHALVAVGGGSDLRTFDVDDPTRPQRTGNVGLGPGRSGLALAHVYNPPFLSHLALVGAPGGIDAIDVTRRGQPMLVGRAAATPRAERPGAAPPREVPFADVAVEAMALDRMIDEDGLPLKDVSHPNARYLNLEELRRVLAAPVGAR